MKDTQINFRIYLKQSSQKIETELNKFSKEWHIYITTNFPHLEKVNKQFTNSLYGGKMLRGTLVKLGYELLETKKTTAIFRPAIAFEILHTSLLIHDDIIDQSSMRRGKPAVHVAENKQYGISQAICLGDLGITQSIKLISESNFSIANKNHALNYFLKIISNTIIGEMLDVESSQNQNRTEEQILKIHQMKTADYTIVGPLSIGALLAGASDTVLKNIKLFGEYLGVAFQIQDDILGIFGQEKKTGKSISSDIEENKSTLLIIYALKHSNQKQKAILEQYYGKKNITTNQQEMIKKIFEETGSLDYSQKKIKKLTEEAEKIISDLTKDKGKQILFQQLTDLLVARNK